MFKEDNEIEVMKASAAIAGEVSDQGHWPASFGLKEASGPVAVGVDVALGLAGRDDFREQGAHAETQALPRRR